MISGIGTRVTTASSGVLVEEGGFLVKNLALVPLASAHARPLREFFRTDGYRCRRMRGRACWYASD